MLFTSFLQKYNTINHLRLQSLYTCTLSHSQWYKTLQIQNQHRFLHQYANSTHDKPRTSTTITHTSNKSNIKITLISQSTCTTHATTDQIKNSHKHTIKTSKQRRNRIAYNCKQQPEKIKLYYILTIINQITNQFCFFFVLMFWLCVCDCFWSGPLLDRSGAIWLWYQCDF